MSEDCKDLIRKCLVKDFSKRISATEALSHKWILEKADQGLSTGTIGGGVSSQVINGIDELIKCTKAKEATLNYLTTQIIPRNFKNLEVELKQKDASSTGLMTNDEFVRCLSSANMKSTEKQVEKLITDLDQENQGKVNYKDFLKFSYLCHMYKNHYELELMLNQLDKDGKGLVTVA